MSTQAQGVIESRTFVLAQEDIDTDQIIPAQFLTTTEREGLGQFCFYQWRFNPDGSPRQPGALDDYDPQRQQVLVAGHNFGCGSSREHAPWALLDIGFRAVISSQFADIFRNNSLKNGLLPVEVSEEVARFLIEHPDHEVRIDIPATQIHIAELGTYDFPLDRFSAHCITEGIDQLDYLIRHEEDIARHEQRRAG
ncbi:3-isopropylmalate dehydratase small subunit [Elongatibacter sediminis]|uniref:3-isopropylmalate dehydratase n=1 Tax=Elongatibacter sediminis TaxID=3119006 RepID=A0AAW9RCG7_9GAMM